LTLFSGLVVPLHEVPSREWLDGTLRMLGRIYRFVSAEELRDRLSRGRSLRGLCHLTFDDGHRTFFEIARPVLEAWNAPASLFVSPAVLARGANYWFQELSHLRTHVDDDALRDDIAATLSCPRDPLAHFSVMSLFLCLPRAVMQQVLDAVRAGRGVPPLPPQNMTVEQLLEVAAHPLVTVGAHSLEHPVLANETAARSAAEIAGSVEGLSAVLSRPITTFAYPNGIPGLDFSSREQSALRRAGITMAFSTQPDFVRATSDRLAIPRGGCPDRHGEPAARAMLRVLGLPWWERWRRLGRRRRVSEEQERRAIQASGVFAHVGVNRPDL
jgi:peptidoglycan/xylan/chitin deacetylase (PgdA/CDA1 family)